MCVVVAYEKDKKVVIEKFECNKLDEILDINKRKPLIDYQYNILEVGVGEVFEERFKTKYNSKK